MTWKSHTAIAAAISLPFNPSALPLALLGSTAPDWLEWVLKFLGKPVAHRTTTHYLIVPLGLILLSFFIDFRDWLFWFGIGYLSHWLADSLTITGVPISPLDKSNFTLFGGRFKTGEPSEYIVAFGLLAISLFFTKPSTDFLNSDPLNQFKVFLMDYKKLNENGVIDNKEYLEMRFKFF
ncbi:metal-dependent hydrolase [Campylobacter porcelli]|uniref:Putative hydrolase (DUF457 domain) n=1 Tax=Campylobacter porcelli TaxID=1660073 RepID=A0A1X9SYZ1_9BACT|nr:metal-dependent hydrolase [Campylobacter sp. RM6137]ARR01450.1 putative hydrolase (DUF457 domain) [Campylobacter sp. RM6137]